MIPTHLEPDVPLALLEAAVLLRVTGAPVAVIPDADRLIVVSAARPIGPPGT